MRQLGSAAAVVPHPDVLCKIAGSGLVIQAGYSECGFRGLVMGFSSRSGAVSSQLSVTGLSGVLDIYRERVDML